MAAGMSREPFERSSDYLPSWISTILTIAADHSSGVSVSDLAELLPAGSEMAEPRLLDWLAAHPEIARVSGGWVYQSGRAMRPSSGARERGEEYLDRARSLLTGPLQGTLPWLRCVGVTGSAAYGEPERDADLDLMIVARQGLLWLSLLRILVDVRFRGRYGYGRKGALPPLCFNYARDERSLRSEFRQARDVLFAREALTVRVVYGEPFYQECLRSAGWMGERLPVLYARRRRAGAPTAPPPGDAPPLLRVLNSLAFLGLATYFQLIGLLRNARLRKRGRSEAMFESRTTLGRLSFDSVKFEAIRARYLAPTVSDARPSASEHGPASEG